MCADNDRIMIYGLQSFAFCKRQFALEFNEQQERVNWHVADGRVFHERVDHAGSETRKDVHVATALRLSSEKYGLTGVGDVVEFHRIIDEFCDGRKVGVKLPKRSGWWRPYPVEYKRGKPKAHRADEVQLCAQAFCLEEMLGVEISEGALFYGELRRRANVAFDDELRTLTETVARQAHDLLRSGVTPPPVRTKGCEACSLKELCFEGMPSARTWIDGKIDEVVGGGGVSGVMNEKPSGWHVDPETGVWRRDTIHSMLRRCRNWNYCGTGVYMITLVLNDRSLPVLGRLSLREPCIELTELGRRIEAHFRRIPEFAPEIEVLGVQVMPEHLHGVLRVTRRMAKPLGEHLRGFKIGATKIARELGIPGIDAGVRGRGLFADGFTDTILFDDEAVAKGLSYVADNPRRLWVKRAHPELFRVLRNLRWKSAEGGGEMHFAAIGNQDLLKAPTILQVQCSRRYFAYARNAKGEIDRLARPVVMTEEFCEKVEGLLAAAEHGAVLVSPCISQGEREIARRAFEAGRCVITLSNKGFNPLYKPGGRLFDQCADGRLLMLAPARWPYLPGEKKITRMDACALNRIAQLIAGTGAVEIDYKGVRPEGIDELVAEVTTSEGGK